MLKNLLLIFVTAPLLVACNSISPPSMPDGPGGASFVGDFPSYVVQAGDELDIRFFRTPELNEIVTVRPDGKISLPLISVVSVAGRTPEQVESDLIALYSNELLEPDINVIVRSFGGQKVYVGGEVRKPGVVEFNSSITVVEAVFLAGGLTDRANTREILIIRKDDKNQPFPLRVDLKSLLAGESTALGGLAATDVIYVPRSRIANANLFVEQYIRGLLMFDGFRVGFGYDLDERISN